MARPFHTEKNHAHPRHSEAAGRRIRTPVSLPSSYAKGRGKRILRFAQNDRGKRGAGPGGQRPPLPHPCGAFVGAACGRPPHRNGTAFYVGRDDPARHGSAFRSRHSEAKGRRIRLPRPWLPQGPHGRRNAFRRDPIFAKSASLLFTPSVRLRRTAPSSRGSCDGAPRSSRPTKEVVPWPPANPHRDTHRPGGGRIENLRFPVPPNIGRNGRGWSPTGA